MIDVTEVSAVPAPAQVASHGPDRSRPGLWVVGGPAGAAVSQGLTVVCEELQLGHPCNLEQPTARQLSEAFDSAPLALVLLDAAWASQQDESVLRALRRHAAGRVLLMWTAPHPQWLELVVRCDARGAIEWPQTSVAWLVQALRAVRAGEMWFPRAFMQQLYETLMRRSETSRSGSAVVAQTHLASGVGGEPPAPLTQREYQVFQLMRDGQSNKQIAAQLAISVNTVKKHLASAFSKTGLRRRRQTLI